MKRRDFISLLGGAAALPIAARAQQVLPVVAFVSNGSANTSERAVAAFRKGLSETGSVEGQNVAVEYHWTEGHYEQLPGLVADVVRRRVAVIATPGNVPGALAAKATTATIPIVFGVNDDPVKLGLVASLARPGGNATGINALGLEITSKRLALLHELVPQAVRIAVLVNPANAPSTEATLREVPEAARALGLEVRIFNASTIAEIDATFVAISREHAEALFVGTGAFFNSRRGQLAILAVRDRLPACFQGRDFVEAGGLMSYGADNNEMYRQVGRYTGSILKGAKPSELPVVQVDKLELVINQQTARAISVDIPPLLLARADQVIE